MKTKKLSYLFLLPILLATSCKSPKALDTESMALFEGKYRPAITHPIGQPEMADMALMEFAILFIYDENGEGEYVIDLFGAKPLKSKVYRKGKKKFITINFDDGEAEGEIISLTAEELVVQFDSIGEVWIWEKQ